MNEQTTTPQQPTQPEAGNTVTLRIPKLNWQVAALGLIALITVFQTYQLTQVSNKASASTVKAAPASGSTTSSHNATSGGSAPEAMVGGC